MSKILCILVLLLGQFQETVGVSKILCILVFSCGYEDDFKKLME